MTIFRCAFWLAAAILADLFIAFLLSRGNKQTGDQSDEAYDDQHGTRETPISENTDETHDSDNPANKRAGNPKQNDIGWLTFYGRLEPTQKAVIFIAALTLLVGGIAAVGQIRGCQLTSETNRIAREAQSANIIVLTVAMVTTEGIPQIAWQNVGHETAINARFVAEPIITTSPSFDPWTAFDKLRAPKPTPNPVDERWDKEHLSPRAYAIRYGKDTDFDSVVSQVGPGQAFTKVLPTAPLASIGVNGPIYYYVIGFNSWNDESGFHETPPFCFRWVKDIPMFAVCEKPPPRNDSNQ